MTATLSAQVRVFATGNGRKTDRWTRIRSPLRRCGHRIFGGCKPTPDLTALRLLVDRRDELGRARTDTLNRIHRLRLELLPGGAKKYLSSRHASVPNRRRWST
ncbi:hypothetical protein [Nocardia brasiliensis]|uniref:hypothetical protein n=1 Tax=Nocardia brasiliensis TaxID=37326 RepID=UPI00366BE819